MMLAHRLIADLIVVVLIVSLFYFVRGHSILKPTKKEKVIVIGTLTLSASILIISHINYLVVNW